jgi:hypothetical protein
MRMGNGDRLEAAEPVDERDGRSVEQRDAVPQNIAVRRADEERALADGKLRLGADADQPRLVLAVGVERARGAGAASVGAYCIPQAVQMKAGMATRVLSA